MILQILICTTILCIIIVFCWHCKKIKNLLEECNEFLSAIAAIATIVGVPFVILGGAQLLDYFERPSLALEFFIQKDIAFQFYNNSKKVAEDVYWDFGIRDVSETTINCLTSVGSDPQPINRGESRGIIDPFSGITKINNKQYLGLLKISCRDCLLKRYWVYLDTQDYHKSWFAEAKEGEIERFNKDPLSEINIDDTISEKQRVYRPK